MGTTWSLFRFAPDSCRVILSDEQGEESKDPYRGRFTILGHCFFTSARGAGAPRSSPSVLMSSSISGQWVP
jgi:hypothetical protein